MTDQKVQTVDQKIMRWMYILLLGFLSWAVQGLMIESVVLYKMIPEAYTDLAVLGYFVLGILVCILALKYASGSVLYALAGSSIISMLRFKNFMMLTMQIRFALALGILLVVTVFILYTESRKDDNHAK